MAGIRMSGLASGLDTQGLIAQLMQVERIPRGRIERSQAAVQTRQDVLKDIQTKLRALKTATTDLNATGLWTSKQAVTSTDAARVGTRSTAPTAAVGTYDVEVTRLAVSEAETWTTRTRPIATTLTFTQGATNTDVAIAANSTTDQVAAQINAVTGAPVTASVVNGNLVLTAKTMGAAGAFGVTGQAMDVKQSEVAGADGQFKVNGTTYTTPNNLSTSAFGGDPMPGVELTLRGLTAAGNPVKVTVGASGIDRDDVKSKLKAYVEAYNSVVDLVRAKVGEKGVANAQTTTDAKKGVLFGDPGLTGMMATLRRGMMDPIAGNPAAQDELHEIGLSTGGAVSVVSPERVQGRLAFDETKFNAAWDADPAAVQKLLRGDGASGGFVQRMESLVKPLIDTGGTLDGRINAAGSQLKTLADSMVRMDKRLERKEDFYKKQFTQLETAMAAAQSMQNSLAGQLAGLPSNSK